MAVNFPSYIMVTNGQAISYVPFTLKGAVGNPESNSGVTNWTIVYFMTVTLL